jgi:hypothetical protein
VSDKKSFFMPMRDRVTHRRATYALPHLAQGRVTYSLDLLPRLERTFNPRCQLHGQLPRCQCGPRESGPPVRGPGRDDRERPHSTLNALKDGMFNRGPPAEPGNQHAHASSNLVLRISVPSRAVLRSRPSPTHKNTCTSTHTPLSQQAALVSCLPQRDTQPALSCALASIPQPLGHVMS